MGELVFQFLDRNDKPVTRRVRATENLIRWLADTVARASNAPVNERGFRNVSYVLALPDGRVSADPIVDGWTDDEMHDCYEIQTRWENEYGMAENGYCDSNGVGICLACNDFPFVSYCLSQQKRERFGI